MARKWKLFTVTSLMALVGITAIAFASDLLSNPISRALNTGVISLAANRIDACPANACSIVFKADGKDGSSTVIDVHR